jgi:hypothetical protein
LNAPPFEWPNWFLGFVLVMLVAASIVPWSIPPRYRRPTISIIPPIVAGSCWFAYEKYLHAIARVGDTLIRIDWLALAPLMLMAVLSALASVGTTRRLKISLFTMMALVAVAAVVAALVTSGGRGVEVVVKNVDSIRVQNVVVHVTGNSYLLGEISPSTEKHVRVSSNGESHVEVSFTGADGKLKREVVDCYFEAQGYNGTIEVDIDGHHIVRQSSSVRTSLREWIKCAPSRSAPDGCTPVRNGMAAWIVDVLTLDEDNEIQC